MNQNSHSNMAGNGLDKPLPSVGGDHEQGVPGQSKKPFTNALRQTDSVLKATGYINEIRSYTPPGSESTMYFVRVGMISGRRPIGDGEGGGQNFENVFQNAEFLVGKTLRYWAEAISGLSDNPFGKVKCKMTIRNAVFIPGIHEGKPVLDSRGILEVVEFGNIEF